MKIKGITILNIFIAIYSIFLIGFAGWAGYKTYTTTVERTILKEEYSKINDIYFGLLSVNAWEEQLLVIAKKQINEFQLNNNQLDVFRQEINQVIHSVIDKAEAMINQNDNTWVGKLTKFAVNNFVNMDKLHEKAPEFTEDILQTLTRPESIEKIKQMARGKLDEMADNTYDEGKNRQLEMVYEKYGITKKAAFNDLIQKKTEELHKEANEYGRMIAGIVALFLLNWFMIRKNYQLQRTFLVFSTLLALVVLATGVTTPMLEIDARITELRFVLLGESITFEEQMVFYQSKSIIDVVRLLLQSKPIDSIIVGFLILTFSVLLPTMKLISFFLLLIVKRLRNWKIINWLTFHSGKWSMADVMIVAIFMSYVAFDGIIHDQLRHINRDTQTVKALTTNHTGLQSGFFIFVIYVFFSMLLSVFLKKLIKPKDASQLVLPQEDSKLE